LYEEFAREQEAALRRPDVPETERRQGLSAVLHLRAWVGSQTAQALARTSPLDAYTLELARARRREREDAARIEAIAEKLDAYQRWAMAVAGDAANPFEAAGRAHLVTSSPLLFASRQALVQAVRDWSTSHTGDPDFLRKSPSEVALYLLAKRAALARLVFLGQQAPAHLDYTPELDSSRYTLDQLLLESAVGFIPLLGDTADLVQAAEGVSLTGYKLDTEDRVLLLAGAMVPFVSGTELRAGKAIPRVLEHVALATGRHPEEVEALLRVVTHLGAADATEINRIVHIAARDRRLARPELEALERLVARVDKPLLAQATEALRRLDRPTGAGLKFELATGQLLVPGSAEHMYQRWIDYQFRYPGKRGSFALAIDPEWQRLYRTILENGKAGSDFQRGALAAFKLEKNTSMMMPPPGRGFTGFVCDAVEGNPAELVWGQPYKLVEAKGWDYLTQGVQNLEAMFQYVENVKDATLTLVVRSAKHPRGKTRFSKPLQDHIDALHRAGKLVIEYYP